MVSSGKASTHHLVKISQLFQDVKYEEYIQPSSEILNISINSFFLFVRLIQ
jgi:hypothetical protein